MLPAVSVKVSYYCTPHGGCVMGGAKVNRTKGTAKRDSRRKQEELGRSGKHGMFMVDVIM